MGNTTSTRADNTVRTDQLLGLEVVVFCGPDEPEMEQTGCRLRRVLSPSNTTGCGGPIGINHKGKGAWSTREFMECISKMDPRDIAKIMRQCQEETEECTGAQPNKSLQATSVPSMKIRNPKLRSYRNTAA
ncbi:hypothetical protein SEMRO_622_G177030.1 [Seminavis robusta]|uniref:Uncharacterized protein n=1 Tax=Seminavis robusta TaxID=568900 RepID=A0A9N8E4X0_9STRA|nr:hypothetical protein SEMRO_622_G177030.1 [Seminavis robusta]|eukprot:Sro622_g177030.1 n/a (131) ;mRNA; r:43944-44336